ncbi:beta-2 adrenergic receptor-like [Branchiostoma lanceolatum]|uniref:beta-2 adrenergic receptor-like n=1 Tax=Branchiostoma lanceolatum TaxID=7740 RepID=UPI003452DE04
MATFNSSMNDTDDFLTDNTSYPVKDILVPDWVVGLTVTWLILSLLAIVVGNVIVICVIIRENSLHKPRYWFNFNLAVADLLQGIVTIPTAVGSLVNEQYNSGEGWCRFQYTVLFMCFQATLFTLVDMGLERTHAIIRPLQHNSVATNAKTVVAIIIIWVMSFAIAMTAHIPALYPGELNIDQSTIVCFIREFVSDEDLSEAFGLHSKLPMQLLRLGLPALCVLIILISYCIVFWEARKQQIHINNIPHHRSISIFKTNAFKTISLHMIVVTIIVVAWVAQFMSGVRLKVQEALTVGSVVTHETFIVLFLTVPSFSNPLVYNFRSEEFHKAFRKFFGLSVHQVAPLP